MRGTIIVDEPGKIFIEGNENIHLIDKTALVSSNESFSFEIVELDDESLIQLNQTLQDPKTEGNGPDKKLILSFLYDETNIIQCYLYPDNLLEVHLIPTRFDTKDIPFFNSDKNIAKEFGTTKITCKQLKEYVIKELDVRTKQNK